MAQLVFLIIIIVISAISSASKKQNTESLSNSPGLDDIFNEVMAASKRNGNSLPSSSHNNFASSKPKKFVRKEKTNSSSLTTPSNHSHVCNDVNYDELDSLMGKNESFNLAAEPVSYQEPIKKPDLKMTRDDLLKSFIMSEVLQRYDINRIHSRIPSANSDD